VVAGVAAVVALAVGAPVAGARPLPVNVEFQAFAPDGLDALPGDTVTWHNIGGRTHTVTADAGAFDSGDLLDGQSFSYTFRTTGTYTYHCVIHPGMVGEVDVRLVTLDPLPPSAVLAKTAVSLTGRSADVTAPVVIEADSGSGFRQVATASVGSDGSWSASVVASRSARLRARSGADLSETRQLLVINRTVKAHWTPHGLAVEVSPSDPNGLVALQFRLRDRFGWWRIAVKRLDYVSEATFRVKRRPGVPARVVLLGPDHWTPVAFSRVF
jgi:plastocyanin